MGEKPSTSDEGSARLDGRNEMNAAPGGGPGCTEIVPLRECHIASGFQCTRAPEIQAFFLHLAWAQERSGQSRTHVMIPSSTTSSLPPAMGFYSLCAAKISATDIQGSPPAGGRAQIPVVLIGQLGRDDRAPK